MKIVKLSARDDNFAHEINYRSIISRDAASLEEMAKRLKEYASDANSNSERLSSLKTNIVDLTQDISELVAIIASREEDGLAGLGADAKKKTGLNRKASEKTVPIEDEENTDPVVFGDPEPSPEIAKKLKEAKDELNRYLQMMTLVDKGHRFQKAIPGVRPGSPQEEEKAKAIDKRIEDLTEEIQYLERVIAKQKVGLKK